MVVFCMIYAEYICVPVTIVHRDVHSILLLKHWEFTCCITIRID